MIPFLIDTSSSLVSSSPPSIPSGLPDSFYISGLREKTVKVKYLGREDNTWTSLASSKDQSIQSSAHWASGLLVAVHPEHNALCLLVVPEHKTNLSLLPP